MRKGKTHVQTRRRRRGQVVEVARVMNGGRCLGGVRIRKLRSEVRKGHQAASLLDRAASRKLPTRLLTSGNRGGEAS